MSVILNSWTFFSIISLQSLSFPHPFVYLNVDFNGLSFKKICIVSDKHIHGYRIIWINFFWTFLQLQQQQQRQLWPYLTLYLWLDEGVPLLLGLFVVVVHLFFFFLHFPATWKVLMHWVEPSRGKVGAAMCFSSHRQNVGIKPKSKPT